MNDKRLPGKLLSNKWDGVKCKGHPSKSCIGLVNTLKKDHWNKVLVVDLIGWALHSKECEEFEMTLGHKCIIYVFIAG